MRVKDTHQREWTISMSVAEYEALCDTHGIDLLEHTTLSKFLQDLRMQLRVAYALCENQIRSHGIDKNSFFSGFQGETLDQLIDATENAVGNFIPNPRVRENYKATRVRLAAIAETVITAIDKKLSDPAAEKKINKAVRTACEEFMNSLDSLD